MYNRAYETKQRNLLDTRGLRRDRGARRDGANGIREPLRVYVRLVKRQTRPLRRHSLPDIDLRRGGSCLLQIEEGRTPSAFRGRDCRVRADVRADRREDPAVAPGRTDGIRARPLRTARAARVLGRGLRPAVFPLRPAERGAEA